MRPARRRHVDDIPDGQPAVASVNIRTLRQRRGWSQAKLGELMGWQNASTVSAARATEVAGSVVSRSGKSSG